jgi:hypothetical protein
MVEPAMIVRGFVRADFVLVSTLTLQELAAIRARREVLPDE